MSNFLLNKSGEVLLKAKYISRKRVGNKWVYKYKEDKKQISITQNEEKQLEEWRKKNEDVCYVQGECEIWADKFIDFIKKQFPNKGYKLWLSTMDEGDGEKNFHWFVETGGKFWDSLGRYDSKEDLMEMMGMPLNILNYYIKDKKIIGEK